MSLNSDHIRGPAEHGATMGPTPASLRTWRSWYPMGDQDLLSKSAPTRAAPTAPWCHRWHVLLVREASEPMS